MDWCEKEEKDEPSWFRRVVKEGCLTQLSGRRNRRGLLFSYSQRGGELWKKGRASCIFLKLNIYIGDEKEPPTLSGIIVHLC